MSETRRLAARLLVLHADGGAVPADWLCEAYWFLRRLAEGDAPTSADLRWLAALEHVYATELAELDAASLEPWPPR